MKVVVVFREMGKLKGEYSLEFDLPEAPMVGDYVSVQRPGLQPPLSEDVVVRKRWWRLSHPSPAMGPDGRPSDIGVIEELFLECDRATGPYSAQHWIDQAKFARENGIEVEEMETSRLAILPR